MEAVQGMFCNKNVALVSHFAWFCIYNLLVAYVASSGTESGVGEFVSSANKHTLGDVESTTIGVGTSRSIPAGSQDHFQLTNEYGETNTDTGIFDGADGKKKEQNSLDSNSNSEKTSTEGMQVYFCKHQDSCGLKPYLLRGPATVDSANNGKTCYCVGPESLSLQTDCYRGSCCDTKNSKCSEHPDRLCRFTVETSENLVSMSKCSNKFLEAIDPMLKHYGENSASTWIDTKKD